MNEHKKKDIVTKKGELLRFLDEYEWDEKEKPFIRGLKRYIGYTYQFVDKCENYNCQFYYQGFCDSHTKKCMESQNVGRFNNGAPVSAKLGFQNNDVPLPHIFRCLMKDYKLLRQRNKELEQDNKSLKQRLDEMTELYENVFTEN